MLTNIVVPLDGSSYSWSAARHAIQMARLCRATVHGVSVTDVKIIEGKLLDDLNIDSETAQTLYQDQGRMLLEQVQRECQASGVPFHPILTAGMIPGAICRTASEVKAELIAMGKRGVNAKWSGPLLGSTAEAVVRLAKRPVLLAQEDYAPIETVYVAYDGAFISVRALRFAASLCACCNWQMCVISIHRSPERRKKLLREASEIADLHNIKIIPIGKSGDVVQRMQESTAEEPSALVVLGARSRRLLGLTLGVVSEQVMRRIPQPVLLYRPLPS